MIVKAGDDAKEGAEVEGEKKVCSKHAREDAKDAESAHLHDRYSMEQSAHRRRRHHGRRQP